MDVGDKMIYTINLYGIELDVYADITRYNDPFGTGDSPDDVDVEILSIELPDSTQDISNLLSDDTLIRVEDLVLEVAGNE
jgi:hypothetical protein